MQWQRAQLAASVDLRLRQDLWERPGKDLVVSTNVNISEAKSSEICRGSVVVVLAFGFFSAWVLCIASHWELWSLPLNG